MQELRALVPSPKLSGKWCRSSLIASSAMEAASLVTPALEAFFMRTVAAAIVGHPNGEARLRARTFIREEASHSAAHRRFNESLVCYLGAPAPGVATVDTLLRAIERHVSLDVRLLLVDLMERGSEIGSRAYLDREAFWSVDCAYARRLFAQHAREELRHSSLIADLWEQRQRPGVLTLVGCAVTTALAAAAYLALSMSWIMFRKQFGRHGLKRISR